MRLSVQTKGIQGRQLGTQTMPSVGIHALGKKEIITEIIIDIVAHFAIEALGDAIFGKPWDGKGRLIPF